MRRPSDQCTSSKEMFRELAKTWIDAGIDEKEAIASAYASASLSADRAAKSKEGATEANSILFIGLLLSAAMLKVVEDGEKLVEAN